MGCSSSTNANSGGGTAQKQDPPAENQGGEQQAAEQTAAEDKPADTEDQAQVEAFSVAPSTTATSAKTHSTTLLDNKEEEALEFNDAVESKDESEWQNAVVSEDHAQKYSIDPNNEHVASIEENNMAEISQKEDENCQEEELMTTEALPESCVSPIDAVEDANKEVNLVAVDFDDGVAKDERRSRQSNTSDAVVLTENDVGETNSVHNAESGDHEVQLPDPLEVIEPSSSPPPHISSPVNQNDAPPSPQHEGEETTFEHNISSPVDENMPATANDDQVSIASDNHSNVTSNDFQGNHVAAQPEEKQEIQETTTEEQTVDVNTVESEVKDDATDDDKVDSNDIEASPDDAANTTSEENADAKNDEMETKDETVDDADKTADDSNEAADGNNEETDAQAESTTEPDNNDNTGQGESEQQQPAEEQQANTEQTEGGEQAPAEGDPPEEQAAV